MTESTETTYAEEAAAELRKARDANDRLAAIAAQNAAGDLPFTDLLRETAGRSTEIAEGFARLAAIEAGLPPCRYRETPLPEPGQAQET